MKRLIRKANAETIINKLKNLSDTEKAEMTKLILANAEKWAEKMLDDTSEGIPSADTQGEYYLENEFDLMGTKKLLKQVFLGQGLDADIDALTEREEYDIWNSMPDNVVYDPVVDYFENEIYHYTECGDFGDPNADARADYYSRQSRGI